MLLEFRAKALRDSKVVKKQANQYSPSAPTHLSDALDSSPQIREKYTKVQLPDVTLLDKDLEAFDAIERDILRAYFANRALTAKQLGDRFAKPYQFVAGLLKRPAVDRLKLKYFYEVLSDETQLALMRGVKAGDSKLIEASAEYLKVLGANKTEEDEYSSERLDVDEHTKRCFKLLADWLTSQMSSDLVIPKPSSPNPTPNQ